MEMKKKISVILIIWGDDTKIEPFLIFKGKRGKNVDKNLQTNINIAIGEIFEYAQEKSWYDELVIYLKEF